METIGRTLKDPIIRSLEALGRVQGFGIPVRGPSTGSGFLSFRTHDPDEGFFECETHRG